ncbi:CPBP family glutamic-type intramembrane protease [Sphingomonas sp. Y38-1Y]|uniref:CPBP family glutamic-type intramembrane protease n=1 Tax=Sphingomonas sp. Y38-1Y TaxID=3078265 RepID=UPI0028E39CC6|nr:CPBP family glutamic-type intramembrane protease [Sphingomonas sp. Y38-1Y]
MTAGVRAAATLAASIALMAAMVLGLPHLIAGPIAGLGLGDAGIEATFTIVVFGVMIGVAATGARMTGGNALTFGGGAGLGAALGLAGLASAVAFVSIAGTLTGGGGASLALVGIVAVAVQVLGEEAFFRGWLQPVLAKGWGLAAAIGVGAAAFAGLHLLGGARTPLTLFNLLLGGLWFGLLAARGGGIAASTLAHLVWNAGEQLVLGLDPNPGLGGFGAIRDFDLVGAGVWGGSEEGLNASLAMTFALLAIVVPLAIDAFRRPSLPAPQLA